MMNRILKLFTTISLCLFVAHASHAQKQQETLQDLMAAPPPALATGDKLRGTIEVFDSMLVHPLADWMPREIEIQPAASTRFNRRLNDGVLHIEMIPKEEPLETWSNLYAILGIRNYPGTNATHANEIARAYKSQCRPSNLSASPLQGNPRIAVIVVACGSFSRKPETGEVAAFVLLQRGKTAVRLYRQWRGKAFRSEDPGQWPISRQALDRVVRSMMQSKLLPRRG